MKAAAIEETRIPRNPLDVLAQQLVAICAFDRWTVSDLHRLVTRADNFRELSREQLEGVLDMLSGRYPSDEFADLKPRVVWDRQTDEVVSRNDARVVAITSGGTIPDRGLFGVFLPGDDAGRGGRRVGELDEEMVYESRVGETFLLGASTWRIEEIRPDRVIVTPAPGEPGKMPFWHGDAVGRPIELGRAIGAFLREFETMKPSEAVARLRDAHAMDELAAKNLVAYLADQREVTGVLPTDRTIVVERFRDELGDWRVVLLTPFGGRVHAPWSMAIEARLREQHGIEVQSIWSDDGIAVRLPEGVESDGSTIEGALLFEPDEIEDRLTADLGSSALFAARFRENAARALLLPRRRPGQRTPLWMQRQRSADLLAVASQYGSFPIILETYREVLRDVFDMPALREVLADIRARRIRMVSVESRSASPFASSLLFDYIGSFMYEGDAPLAERRAQALALDRELLAELLGSEELRELIDPAAVADLELELQALAPDPPGSNDRRRRRPAPPPRRPAHRRGRRRRVSGLEAPEALGELEATRRAIRVRIAGEERWIAVEDAARYRDAVGVSPPPGVAETFLAPVDRPLDLLLARWARTHAPFTADEPAARWDVARAVVEERLRSMAAAGELLEGAFRPGGAAHEFTDPDVLRQLRRRSLARLRREVEPVEPEVLARFLPAWHGVGSSAGGLGRLIEAVAQLEGLPLPASVLERDVLPARVAGYTPRLLDELGAAGEVVWIGRGSLGRDDGRVALFRRDRVDLLAAAGSGRRPAVRTDPRRDPAAPPAPRRVVLPAAALGWRGCAKRRGAAGRPVGPRLGGRGHQRHVRPAAGAVAATLAVTALATTRTGPGARSAARRRALVAGGRPRRRGAVADRARARPGDDAARAPRRRDPRGGRRRGNGRRVRIGLPGAAGDGGVRSSASRLLRGGARGGAVRTARRRRPPARDPRRRADGARAGRHRSGAAVWRSHPVAARIGRRAAPAPARRRRVCRARRRFGGPVPRARRPEPVRLPAGGGRRIAPRSRGRRLPSLVAPGGPMRELRIERVDREPVASSDLAPSLTAVGFRPSYRGFILRRS